MYKTGATAVDSSAEEGHANRLLMRNALEGTDKVSSLKILRLLALCIGRIIHASIYL